MFNEDPALSDRYVHLARKISTRYKVRIPRELKRRFCKHCFSFLVPGKNCRVRTHEGKVVYYCLKCKKFMRFPYSKRKMLDA
jgi:ribonuclease P protein subunit RPR2